MGWLVVVGIRVVGMEVRSCLGVVSGLLWLGDCPSATNDGIVPQSCVPVFFFFFFFLSKCLGISYNPYTPEFVQLD